MLQSDVTVADASRQQMFEDAISISIGENYVNELAALFFMHAGNK